MGDPIYRCDGCRKIIQSGSITKNGCCPKCKNMRFVEVTSMNLREYLKVRFWWRIDSEFLDDFKGDR